MIYSEQDLKQAIADALAYAADELDRFNYHAASPLLRSMHKQPDAFYEALVRYARARLALAGEWR